jgi:hypothetical protein
VSADLDRRALIIEAEAGRHHVRPASRHLPAPRTKLPMRPPSGHVQNGWSGHAEDVRDHGPFTI